MISPVGLRPARRVRPLNYLSHVLRPSVFRRRPVHARRLATDVHPCRVPFPRDGAPTTSFRARQTSEAENRVFSVSASTGEPHNKQFCGHFVRRQSFYLFSGPANNTWCFNEKKIHSRLHSYASCLTRHAYSHATRESKLKSRSIAIAFEITVL